MSNQLQTTLVRTGCFGFMPGGGATYGNGKTTVDVGRPINVAGTLSRLRCLLYGLTGQAPSLLKFYILRDDGGGGFTTVGAVDCTTEVQAAWSAADGGSSTRFSYDTSATYGVTGPVSVVDDTSGEVIEVQSGDYLAIAAGSNVFVMLYVQAGFDTKEGAGDTTAFTTTVSDLSLIADVTIETDESIIMDDSTGFSDGDIISVPLFATDAYWIHIIGVSVPTGEDLTIQLRVPRSTGIDYDDSYIVVTSGTPGSIKLYNSSDTELGSWATSFSAGDKYDIHLYRDPTASNSAAMKCNIVNYVNGEGPDGGADYRHVSLTGREFVAVDGVGGVAQDLRRVYFNQSTGSGASVDRIVVSRQPVVVVGDSFTSQYTSGTSLAHVGALLDNDGVFTQQRYVINGGRTGNRVLDNALVSIDSRFDSYQNDLCDYPDTLYVFVNGPGINDIVGVDPSSNDEAERLAKALAATIISMAKKAIWQGADAVLSELCYIHTGSEYKDAYSDHAVAFFNDKLRKLAGALRLPLARPAVEINSSGDNYGGDNLHLSATGDSILAASIVTAWEGNLIPRSNAKANIPRIGVFYNI